MLYMSRLRQTAFRLDPELLEALQAIKRRDGIPVSEQVRRALETWVSEKGFVKSERQRGATRKRP
jgi:hypothetical protein